MSRRVVSPWREGGEAGEADGAAEAAAEVVGLGMIWGNGGTTRCKSRVGQSGAPGGGLPLVRGLEVARRDRLGEARYAVFVDTADDERAVVSFAGHVDLHKILGADNGVGHHVRIVLLG